MVPAKRKIFSVMPAVFISFAARMNSGMPTRTKVLQAELHLGGQDRRLKGRVANQQGPERGEAERHCHRQPRPAA